MKIRVTFRSGRMFSIDTEPPGLDIDSLAHTLSRGGCFISRAKNSTIVAPADAIEMVEVFN